MVPASVNTCNPHQALDGTLHTDAKKVVSAVVEAGLAVVCGCQSGKGNERKKSELDHGCEWFLRTIESRNDVCCVMLREQCFAV